jgi:hypothetical protein
METKVIARLLKNMAEATEGEPLSEAIEMYLLKRHRARRRLRSHTISMVPRPRPHGRLSPSSLGGCKREAAFKFLGVEGQVKIDPDLELIFEDGNWRHHKWQALFLDMQAVLGRKRFRVVSFESDAILPGLFVAGSLDVHIVVRGVHYIIDIKGINDFGFKRVCIDQDAPMPKHIDQLVAYMKAKKVRRGIILYENKDKNQVKNFLVQYSKEQWKEVVTWCDSVINYMENERLPPRHVDCNKGQFGYRKCIFARICYGKQSGDEIRDMIYEGFTSVEMAWDDGFRALEEANARNA